MVGPVCETGDFLAKDRSLAICAGDYLCLMSAGAYGFVMSSNYNSRPRAPEVMVDGDQVSFGQTTGNHRRSAQWRKLAARSSEITLMLMKFTKMHGLGNDFVVIDAVTQNVRITASMVRRLADRKTGIGCDQVLVIEPPSAVDVDFNYRIFNCDGAEVEQCGNGARCLARFVHDRQLTGKKSIQVQTSNRVMTLNLINKNLVAVDMGIPELDPPAIPFQANEPRTALRYRG